MIDPNDEKDFQDFMNTKGANPPEELTNKILSFVKNDLNPSHKIVFSKLLGIQAFIGLLTMTFCPQFSLSLTNRFELFHYFHHQFGENICMAICGSIFIGSGAIFAAYFLKASEVRKIKESTLLYYTCVSIVALTFFFILGSEVYLTLTLSWLFGATLSGSIVFEVNRLIRNSLLEY